MMEQKHVLVLGGNGFIGYEFLSSIFGDNCAQSESNSWSITLLNRGKSWDWNKEDTIKEKVCCIKWDRDKELTECAELQSLLKTVETFHAVVDFSGYCKRQVKNSLELLSAKTRLYVFISTDSVYEVCCKDHDGITLETDDQRPDSSESVKKLKRQDSYGHKKLRCEEYIHKHLKGSDAKYVMLRLADVIGARDSTGRFWQYHLWVKLAVELDIPLIVPKDLQESQLSFVYVRDIAELILKLLMMTDQEISKLSQNAYNLAFRESVKIEELLNIMHIAILSSNCVPFQGPEGQTLRIDYNSSSKVPHIYPSVEKGPISIQKALDELPWNPSDLKQAVSDSCKFYEGIGQSEGFTKEKQEIASDFLKDMRGLYSSDVYDNIKTCLSKLLN